MKQKDSISTKEKILEVAEQVFAEVGFDGARVDEIAARAGVNKALIYYYFENKDAILSELFERLMEDGRRVQVKALADIPEVNTREEYMELMERNLEFAISRRNLLKIALTESMKSNSKHSGLLGRCDQIINTELEHIKRKYEGKGLDFPYFKKDLAAMEFFIGIMPIFNYAVYFDVLAEYYGMSEAEVKESFLKAFRLAHLANHKDFYPE